MNITSFFRRKVAEPLPTIAAHDVAPFVDVRANLALLRDWHMARAEHYERAFQARGDWKSYARYQHSAKAVRSLDAQLGASTVGQQITQLSLL